jgi:hypothetical protein
MARFESLAAVREQVVLSIGFILTDDEWAAIAEGLAPYADYDDADLKDLVSIAQARFPEQSNMVKARQEAKRLTDFLCDLVPAAALAWQRMVPPSYLADQFWSDDIGAELEREAQADRHWLGTWTFKESGRSFNSL